MDLYYYLKQILCLYHGMFYALGIVQWRTEGGGGGVRGSNPPEIPKALQNRAKLNPIVKTVKNC